jgi:competence protein ComGC
MINQQLIDYIRQQIQRGIDKEQIKNSLIASGWQLQDIEEAFSIVLNSDNKSQSFLMPNQKISYLPGVLEILGQAWSIYKQRIGVFLGVTLIPILVILTASVILVGGGFLSMNLLSSKFAASGLILVILLIVLLFILASVIQTWGQIALIYAIKDSQEKIGVIESYRRGWHKILSYWWVLFLTGLITTGGFILLIVPGIIFSVWFSLAIFILISENLKGMNALLKSREYVKGKWGSVFWRLFFMGALTLIISLPLLALGFVFTLLKIPFASEITGFVIGLFLTPLMMTYYFLVYNNLKALKGEIIFTPTVGKKLTFIFIGILGILLVSVIFFLGIFSGINSAKERSYDVKQEAAMKQIKTVLEIYYRENNRYPDSLEELSPNYLSYNIIDLLKSGPYEYKLNQNGKDYQLCIGLNSAKNKKCVSSQF